MHTFVSKVGCTSAAMPRCRNTRCRVSSSKMFSGASSDVVPHFQSSLSRVLNQGGRSMSKAERAFFEPRFGADFSRVRIHDNSQAANAAKQINARAFTLGRNVVFGSGQNIPESGNSKRLLAHELTHVLQQQKEIKLQRKSENERNYIELPPIQITAGPPKGRIIEGRNFHRNLDGVVLSSNLYDNVKNLSNHLIQNKIVWGNIIFTQGVRSPKTAHLWSTAYNIRKGRIPLKKLKALSDGKDSDGNLWYQLGWNRKKIINNALKFWSGKVAAEGYPRKDPRRKPNTNRPPVSRHVSGFAMDVSIPWWKFTPWSESADKLVKMFGLKRPIRPKEPWHFQLN